MTRGPRVSAAAGGAKRGGLRWAGNTLDCDLLQAKESRAGKKRGMGRLQAMAVLRRWARPSGSRQADYGVVSGCGGRTLRRL
jgi:hypothetical protein